ncbi:MAG: substrate-binding domain-containing protein [Polyangiaceae bacterium]
MAGELQGAQSLRLVKPGAFVMLITGAAKSPTAMERQRGFLSAVGRSVTVTHLDGRWSAQEAERALSDWFKVGAERERHIDLVVCQNDAMAIGARRALTSHAALANRPELANTPTIGCDGIEEEGQQMVLDGALAATVILPATTPAALEVLQRYWGSGVRADMVQLDVQSFPTLADIRPDRWRQISADLAKRRR